jgi:cell division protein FtsI/penicillin-binding protein 2
MSSYEEQQTSQHRLTVLGLCLTFGLAVLLAQLFRYQVILHPRLKQKVIEQRVNTKVLVPERGRITDANNYLLAVDVSYWEIAASPDLISDPDALADQLATLLRQDRAELHEKLTSSSKWVLLARNVPQAVGEAVASLEAGGLICTPKFRRAYPMHDLVAHSIGIVNITGHGFYGVEGYYDAFLRGITGTLEFEAGPMGEVLPIAFRTLRAPQPGMDLILTLDLNIQHIAQQELQRALDRFEAKSGTVIVMDPKTGAILAHVSLPTYDPNEYATAEPSLLADPSVSRMWEPGSVFKIITWGAGLDAGIITPDMEVFDEGEMEVGGRVIANADRKAHREVTMTEALVQSLNTVAAYISTSLGKDRFYNYVRRFGFGDLTGVDLASEGPGMMKYPGDSNWFPSELGTNSFGQGIAVTPVQMIAAAAAVANDGVLMKPYIVHQLIGKDQEGNAKEVVQVEPTIVRQAISKEAARELTEILVKVVERKATEARVPGYRIAGKTGTAQIPTPFGYERKDTIVSFVGYAPADDPQFIVLVKLDRPRTSRWAAHTAAPAFGAIAERLIAYLQIPPDEFRLAEH